MSVLGDIRRFLWRGLEALIPILLWPINRILAVCLRYRYRRGSVLHVCYPVHIVYYTVQLLRAEGGDADYLAIGSSRDWELCDHRFERWRAWMPLALTEFYFFWTVMARYHILHLHFMQGISRTGWEWSVLKLLGRRIVVYYSGCEIRDRDLNAELHPGMNICEECDYASELCSGKISRRRRKLSARYADLELITTPDMRDFVPQGIHFPFFCPPDDIIPPRTRPYWPENKVFRVVHVTNHPGIEGTAAIAAACEMVRAQGHAVEFRHLLRTPYGQVLQEMADADLSIGKMKMGYYANAQIEALSCGTPCISHL